ncbi:MAG TPA: hypothetical protein PKJ19_06510, partial [Flavobacteriales bacterium]|nr:hypothetical protein [Flavobacteriales bacterium]
LDWLPGAGGYLAVVLLLALLVHKTRRFPEHRVVGGLIALSAGIKLWLAVRFAIFPLHADQELFHRYVRDMADLFTFGIPRKVLDPQRPTKVYQWSLRTSDPLPG